MTDEFWRRPAADVADAVRRGETSATAIITEYLARVDAINPSVNALTVVFHEKARHRAAEVDELIASGADPGLLAGVPFTVKENIDFTWSATTEGATFLADNVPPANATMVQRFLDAGAVPVGRGNMPDFGLRWDTDNDLFGRTLNPWDKARVPHGSSGGDAVAVATGMTSIGFGNDYGGSLRLPAIAAGVCALRTSAGRVPAPVVAPAPVPLSLQFFAVNGPIARTVDDLDLAFGVMHGADDRDPLSLSVPHPSSYDGPKRVAVTKDPLGWGVSPAIAEAIDRSAAALRAAGWEVEEIEPPMIEEAATSWRRLSSSEMGGLFAPGALPAPLSDAAVQYFRDNVVGTELLTTAESYGAEWAGRVVIQAAWRAFQSRYPVVLAPVSTQEPFPIGYDLDGPEACTELWRRHRMVVAVNFLGLPAVALSTHVQDGIPAGVQLIGPMHGEHVALAAARDVESRLGRLAPVDPQWATS